MSQNICQWEPSDLLDQISYTNTVACIQGEHERVDLCGMGNVQT